MAHSYVTAFGCSIRSEYKADAYIKSHMGEGLILLVDTYDTLKSGIKMPSLLSGQTTLTIPTGHFTDTAGQRRPGLSFTKVP